MAEKLVELDYDFKLDKKLISKIGNPFKFDDPSVQDAMNKFYETENIVIGKKILVIRMFDIAKKYAENNSVIYITDNHEKHDKFLEIINSTKYGSDDNAFFVEDYTDLSFIFGEGMPAFDLIIGNPPYEGKGNPLYLQILEKCNENAQSVIWLCPSQWVKNYKDSEYLKTVKTKTCKNLISHEYIGNPFVGSAVVANEIGIYVFGENANYENYDEIKLERFSNPSLAKSIWAKFENFSDFIEKYSREDKNLSFYVRAQWIRGHFCESKPCWDWTTLFGSEQKVDFKKHKLEATTTSKPHFWNFATEAECKNFIASTETDICMFAHFICKINQANNNQNIALIPWFGDYTKAWTEKEIAEKIGLTKEEIDYIHEEMKPFGWKAQPNIKKKHKSKKDYFVDMDEE